MSLALIGVREYPRLGETTIVTTPNGTRHRWAEDEPDAAKAPTDSQHGSTAPGGYANWTATLPRKPGSDYGDVAPLSDVEILDAAGDIIFSGRLDEAPKVSGDQMSVTPQAVGHQALLEDVKGINFLGIDPRADQWQEAPLYRRQFLHSGGFVPYIGPQPTDDGRFVLSIDEVQQSGTAGVIAEAHYVSPAPIGQVVIEGEYTSNLTSNWLAVLRTAELNGANAAEDSESGPGGTTTTLSVTAGFNHRRAYTFIRHNAAQATLVRGEWAAYLKPLVVGDHGLPLYDSIAGTKGLLASDIIVHNIQRWAPSVKPRNVQRSDFVIPISAIPDTTVAGIIADCNRYQLWNWAVWEEKSFDYAPVGQLGRRWKARTGPSQLRETGQTAKRIRNGVIVHYTDVDGTTKSVGPPGSGATVEDPLLLDSDPLNPANQAGVRMWESISMKGYGTTASATQVGREYLRQIRQLDRSGEAVIVGWIEDPSGNLHPHTSVRANDVIEFVDSSDPSPRLIVEAQHSRAARETRITLDAPRDAMEAIMDRLQISVEGVVG